MERAAADAVRIAAGRETEPEGTVRLTAPPGLANWWIAPTLARLRAAYPRLRIALDAAVGYADLTRREADLAIRGARPTSGDLVAVRLAEATWSIVAAPALVKRIGKLKRFEQVDWISWAEDLAHLPDARWLAAHVPAERIALRTSSMDAQLHAARAGLGALLLPEMFLRLIDLAVLPLERSLAAKLQPMPGGALWLVGHRALREVPRVRAVWDFVLAEARRWTAPR
jgi:DNA-binding transcriptional LysR family regulator